MSCAVGPGFFGGSWFLLVWCATPSGVPSSRAVCRAFVPIAFVLGFFDCLNGMSLFLPFCWGFLFDTACARLEVVTPRVSSPCFFALFSLPRPFLVAALERSLLVSRETSFSWTIGEFSAAFVPQAPSDAMCILPGRTWYSYQNADRRPSGKSPLSRALRGRARFLRWLSLGSQFSSLARQQPSVVVAVQVTLKRSVWEVVSRRGWCWMTLFSVAFGYNDNGQCGYPRSVVNLHVTGLGLNVVNGI